MPAKYKIGLFLFFLLLSFIKAHPFSSYLDGPFVSFGMGGGPGDIMQSSNATSINAQAQQAYQAEINAYDKAISSLQANKEQTITQLKNLAEQLQEANPSSVALDHLVDKLDALAKNPDVKNLLASVNSSLSAYQQYLENTINSYNKENQQLINSAQQALKHDETQINQAYTQNLKTLKQAISTFNSLNSVNEQIAKDLCGSIPSPLSSSPKNPCKPYTPLSLPPPLDTNGGNVSSLTPSEAYQALLTLSGDINQMVGTYSQDVSTLNQVNQAITTTNTQNLDNLNAIKNADITNALNQVLDISYILGRAFHYQWVNYADGVTYSLNNAAHENYIDAGDTCVFNIVIYGSISSSCGVAGGTSTTLSNFDNALTKYGLTYQDVWGTLFDPSKLQIGPNKYYIEASNHHSSEMGTFFNALNNYVGAAGFKGNLTTSSYLYTLLEGDLNNGNFTQATDIVNAYANTFIPDMLNFFVLNPVWIMSGVEHKYNPPGNEKYDPSVPLPSSYKSLPNVHYCESSPTVGMSFSQGYNVCWYNPWANAIFLGYFGFLPNTDANSNTQRIEEEIDAQLGIAQTSINTAQSAYNDWKDFTPMPRFSIPSMPNIPTLTPTNPTGIIPISTNAANLPQVQKPQAPLITFSTKDLRQNSLRIGLFTTAGYQKYFNSFVGMSYYGYAGYRYLYMGTQSSIDNLNRYQLGVGSNLLFNVYSKISVPKMGLPRIGHVQVRAYGLFAGLLGVVNFWNANYFGGSLMRYDLNIDATVGISARFNRFKWSLGAHIPLVNQTRTLDPDGNLKLIDSYKSTDIFMDFTTFF
ncbi:outer membrane beta-barrel protein [Helicobacter suis]|uniref:outer membrane beta-barrel protein n=1 Tax=Helicobacter suis TaxID=104628 RepID=UPI001967E7EB|nr:outer membrane beta-barrel protein [Helicobacter suis]